MGVHVRGVVLAADRGRFGLMGPKMRLGNSSGELGFSGMPTLQPCLLLPPATAAALMRSKQRAKPRPRIHGLNQDQAVNIKAAPQSDATSISAHALGRIPVHLK